VFLTNQTQLRFIKKSFLFLSFLIQISGSSYFYAQNPSQIDVLTTEQGLLFREVISIEQDKNGFMWFATSQGLNRYDGYNFKAYNSDKNNPYFIEEDKITGNTFLDKEASIFWFLGNDKLFALDIVTDHLIAYDTKHNIKGKVLAIHKNIDGGLWIITDDFWTNQRGGSKQYLQKFENGKFQVVASIPRNNRGFVHLLSDANGFIWWNTTNGNRKYSREGDFIEEFDLDCYDFFGSNMHFVTSFFDSKNNHYYFPTSLGGVQILNENSNDSKRVLDINNKIINALEDNQNHIWFYGSKSLYRMNPKGEFINYTHLLQDRLDYSSIIDLFLDSNNLLWVATDNGLFKIRIGEQLFSAFFNSEKQGWGNTMRGIFEDNKGNIFSLCESANKIFYKSPNGKIDSLQLETVDGTRPNIQYAASFFVLNDAKTHAYTASKELLKIDLSSGKTKVYDAFTRNLRIYGPNPIIKLSNGNLLFGYTLSRLVMFNPETETTEIVFKNTRELTDIEPLTFIEESNEKNIVWIGTQNNGLLKVNLNGNIEKVFHIDSKPSLSKNNILVIEEDIDGSIWVGTFGGGLNHISADETTIRKFTKSEGLPDNNIVGILTDQNNNLWLSTYNGVSYFRKKKETFQNYFTEDGLTHNEFNYASFFKDSKDNYYFGGMNGVNRFEPGNFQDKIKTSNLKLLKISGYNSNKKENYSIDLSELDSSTIEISPYVQYFQVNWTMPSYFHNEKNTYSTILEGYEDQWIYQGNTPYIRYNKLPAGEYILKIKGADSRGNEANAILSIPITVKQVFYKSWWFITLILLCFLGITYAIFKWRLRQLLAIEQLRTRISSDLHDDVGSLLSGLAMQTELMEMNATQEDKFKLQKIAGISRRAISQMRDLVWSIDSRRETVGDLIERMQELAEELLLPRDISFKIDSSSLKKRNKKVSSQVKQNIFLIYKEAITNVLKHSDADYFNVIIANNLKGSSIIIHDNGKSKESYKSTGFGLDNMKMRAKAIGGTIEFDKKDGFTVILNLPFTI